MQISVELFEDTSQRHGKLIQKLHGNENFNNNYE
jgi:hypothetical protein